MHGEVLTYNSGTGVLTVDIKNHTGSGTYTAWVVNVGGVTPATSVAWGSITGTLSTQTDLQTALDLKAALESPTFTTRIYTPAIRNILNTDLVVDAYNDTGAGTHYLHKFTPNDGKFVLATNGGGLTFPDSTTQVTAGIADALSDGYGYVRKDGAWSYSPKFSQVEVGTQTTLASGQYLINDGSFVTNITVANIALEDIAGYGLTLDNTGLTFPDATTQTTAGIPDAPSDGTPYVRLDGAWEQLIIT
jgi:hypothetical protein